MIGVIELILKRRLLRSDIMTSLLSQANPVNKRWSCLFCFFDLATILGVAVEIAFAVSIFMGPHLPETVATSFSNKTRN